jgi:preprotein translocase subunit SecF
MELFKNTNFDFLGKKWPAIGLSLVVIAAGLVSMAMQGGLRYGIDFKGGALMTVKFASDPPIDRIRKAIRAMTVQTISGGGLRTRSRSAPSWPMKTSSCATGRKWKLP